MFPCLTLLASAAFFVSVSRAQESGFPLVTAYSAAEIGTEAMGWVTVQGADGTLHFGCNALVDFDGERWRTSPINGAYALRGLDFGKDGRLWAAAVGEIGWFTQAAGATHWVYHSLVSSLPKEHVALGDVWQVFAEDTGAVFITAEKILRWDGNKMQVWEIPGPAARRLHAMRVGGTIYVHHRATGLYALGDNGPRLLIPASRLGEGMIFWMEPRRDGWLFATSKGLFTYENGQLQSYAPEVSDFVVRNSLTSALRMPDGRIALGTLTGGIALVQPDGKLDRILNQTDGLPNCAVFSLFVDRDHRLWATSNSGIFNVPAIASAVVFDERARLSRQPVVKILRSHGRITLATIDEVYELETDGRYFRPLEGFPGQPRDLMPVDGGLVAAGMHGLKFRKAADGGGAVVYSTPQDAFVAKPARHWPGGILISAGHSIVLLDAKGSSRVLVQNLPDIAQSIAEDNSGRLWLGTASRGVLVAMPDSSTPVEAVQAGPGEGIPEFGGPGLAAAAPDGSLLVFSNTGGWIRGRDARNFYPISGHPQREIAAASEIAADGTMWAAYLEGDNRPACIARITIKGNHATWQPHSVEGLWNIGAPRSIMAEPNGASGTVLWIGGTKGMLRNVVANGPVAPKPGAPLLHAFVRGAEKPSLEPITRSLPYSTRSIIFEFAAPEYALRPALRLETRIDGIDDRWIPADSSSRRELTAIRDGRYAFKVRAVAETGAISETTSFRFEVLPPWWRTAPAIAGLLLAILPMGFGAYRLRVAALQRRNAELEQKVRERTAQLEQASAAKTQFVANMSHDIRNPLNGIVGLALALENSRLDPHQREIIATLRECTTYLSTLVDDVLDFASIEAGRVELRPGPFVPGELLTSIVTMLRADATVSGATLTVETDPALARPMLGDAGRIQQVLVNYVANALKYAGGSIRLTATLPVESPGEVEFSVGDEGAGISEAEQGTLFSKFTRLDGALRSKVSGSGLGLASCRLLADLMGGSVGVASSPGHGSRFYLRLPRVAATAPAEPARLSLADTSVLLVEDTDYNAWAASAVLAKLGLTCERARTGQEAIDLFAARRFNLVLLDRNLPDMDGTVVARKIRALETDGPRAILLAVTAYCTPQDRELCLAAGMDAFVGKPLTPDKLRKILIAAGRRLLTAATMHVSPDGPAPAIDLSLLDYMSDGSEQGLDNQVRNFLAALTEGESRLTAAARTRDLRLMGDAAHYLLSHARLVGSKALEEAAISLEQAARSQDGFAFGELLHRVRREVRAVTEAMRPYHHAGQTA